MVNLIPTSVRCMKVVKKTETVAYHCINVNRRRNGLYNQSIIEVSHSIRIVYFKKRSACISPNFKSVTMANFCSEDLTIPLDLSKVEMATLWSLKNNYLWPRPELVLFFITIFWPLRYFSSICFNINI